MRVWHAFAAAVWACALWIGPESAGASTPTGGIYVTSLPSGADVWIDGTYVGRSPVFVDALARGHHAITLTKTGWAAQQADVDVVAGGVAMSSSRLVAGAHAGGVEEAGVAVLRGVPAAAKLTLDGGIAISDPRVPLPLAAGVHQIVVTTSRGKLTRSFAVVPGTSTQVVLRAPRSDETRSGVVALAEDYLPEDAFTLEGKKFVVRYAGHIVVGHDGALVAYDTAPESISGRLFLPLALLQKLTDDTSKSK
jgi:hypothetical protein